jgi:hypothetical protein
MEFKDIFGCVQNEQLFLYGYQPDGKMWEKVFPRDLGEHLLHLAKAALAKKGTITPQEIEALVPEAAKLVPKVVEAQA